MWFPTFTLFLLATSSAGSLHNPDFESPPSNLPQSSTSTSVLLGPNSTIPGWTHQGTVHYVTAAQTLELPHGGHAIQLGPDGKINQTFFALGDAMNYILTFTLIPGGQNCSSNAALIVSGPDSKAVFSYRQSYSKHSWQSYGHNLGTWGDGEPINLVLESQTMDSDANSTCWPIIDQLLIKTDGVTLVPDNGNLVLNGGFEYGPAFLPNSTEGVLLEAAPSIVQSALRQWSVIGTVRYIDSGKFLVPQGKAAVEIIRGGTGASGIQTATGEMSQSSRYNLTFTVGDGGEACRGEFVVGVEAGRAARNFTIERKRQKLNMVFEADQGGTLIITLMSYSAALTDEAILCGPVVDEVLLRPLPAATSPTKPACFSLFAFLFISFFSLFN